jgi:hypothetical protein
MPASTRRRADGPASQPTSALVPPLLYLDQNYLSGIAKRKPAFAELEPVLRAAVAARVVAVPESVVHHEESVPRPDLGLPALLRELSGAGGCPPNRGPRAGR